MKEKKYISWRRVSTAKQGCSGLGLEAQAEIIRYMIEREGGELVADYAEVYTGKDLAGCRELRKAMHHAKESGAVLIIAKTDRFRNTAEALAIYEEMDGQIMFCDLPHTDKFTLTLFFALAEREALIVSIRTKQALAAKRARGEIWGRNIDTTRATEEASRVRTEELELWKQTSESYLHARGRILDGWDNTTILAEFDKLYERNPKLWCTRNGAKLSRSVLVRWRKWVMAGATTAEAVVERAENFN